MPVRVWLLANLLAISSLCMNAGHIFADVKVHGLFSSHMVLQQGVKVPVWGTADDGDQVTVTIGDQKHSTTAAGGKWRVDLSALKSGPAATLVIAGKNKIELADVLVGEVWLAGGQSNMQWELRQTSDADKYIAAADLPQIRLYTVPREGDDKPRSNVRGNWSVCNSKSAPRFSSVGFHFARMLQPKLGVPVGVISSNVGGTAAEEWTSRDVLESNPIHKPTLRNSRSTRLYNAMIHPLAPFAFRGAIWYQGESNAGRAEQYRTLFPAMIKNWRELWGQGNFPFLLVQLAPFRMIVPDPVESDWAELREAQHIAAKTVPNAAMAVITDVGDERDIHPPQKAPVGERLALAARAVAYGEKIVYSGPEYERLTVDGNRAILHFKHVGGGLVAKSGQLTGFTVCGEDKRFHNAAAKIDGDTVVVVSDKVSKPVAVRFGWADYPVVNLFNKEGLPASPFRTDEFPGKTAGRR